MKKRKFDLKNKKTYTSQGIFDFVVTRLADQGKRSRRSEDSSLCSYRGPNGLKCAVGHLIPDSLYKKEMDYNQEEDGSSVEQILRDFNKLKYFKPFKDLLSDLQVAHDWSSNVDIFKIHLKRAAKNHGLKSSLVGFIKDWS